MQTKYPVCIIHLHWLDAGKLQPSIPRKGMSLIWSLGRMGMSYEAPYFRMAYGPYEGHSRLYHMSPLPNISALLLDENILLIFCRYSFSCKSRMQSCQLRCRPLSPINGNWLIDLLAQETPMTGHKLGQVLFFRWLIFSWNFIIRPYQRH